ncbi:hypothetical protein WALSEDRAFT_60652 [Wallemia mellicola CBS 633.66]|uniref:Uncharacterized protein n=1 Tax=Wallemia mellicola (strain ATCC MYA-4683 / CBS 633.66) TaxID=671144 RepID=I4YAF7_WALMC|nr:hypothetical protein WALSEDRAFT_60652 [Wallemia mellicola CBS 633.66]EIM20949.1 hypothetical protein WALSEDRAFT_60652 [Wallemia mellicola CBS 633.66]|eukprot:XP_006958942.1 hypothetical protein WALSEDRAFT_60652 [Wallemia mellicola CBS 633.66]
MQSVSNLDDLVRLIKEGTCYSTLFKHSLIVATLVGVIVLLSLIIVSKYTTLKQTYLGRNRSDLLSSLLRSALLLSAGFGSLAFSIQDAPLENQIFLLIVTNVYAAITFYLDSAFALLKHIQVHLGVVKQLKLTFLTSTSLIAIASTYFDKRLWSPLLLILGYNVVESGHANQEDVDYWLENCAIAVTIPIMPDAWNDETRYALIGSIAMFSAIRRWYVNGFHRNEESLQHLSYPVICWMVSKMNGSLVNYSLMLFVAWIRLQQPTDKLGWSEVSTALQAFAILQYVFAMGCNSSSLVNAYDVLKSHGLKLQNVNIALRTFDDGSSIKYAFLSVVMIICIANMFKRIDIPLLAFFLLQISFLNVVVLLIYALSFFMDVGVKLDAAVSLNIVMPIIFACSSILFSHLKNKREETIKWEVEEKNK